MTNMIDITEWVQPHEPQAAQSPSSAIRDFNYNRARHVIAEEIARYRESKGVMAQDIAASIIIKLSEEGIING